MSNKLKFKRTLEKWKESESLRHQKKSEKSLAKKFFCEIKRSVRIIVNFFYLRFFLSTQFTKATLAQSINKTTAITPHTLGNHVNSDNKENQHVLAIVIHAFYFDIFTRIIEKTRSIGIPYTIYITTHKGIAQEVSNHMRSLGLNPHIEVYDNKGRDILPFLKIIKLVKTNGHQVLLKLHTKKSPHKFNGGKKWCDRMVNTLLEKSTVDKSIESFTLYPEIGIIGPYKHLYPIWLKGNSNILAIKKLAGQIAYEGDISDVYFVGGTMFYARINTFDRLINPGIKDTDFEKEPISTDGTLAHVLERFFGLVVSLEGLETVDTRFLKLLNEQDTS